jgi:DNA-binding FadR family transcriptional regulator
MIETALLTSFRLSGANPEGPRHSLPLHGAILDAIRRRDAQAAAAAMHGLLAGAAEDVRRALAAGRVMVAARRRSARRRPSTIQSNA